ncbi:HNH endonuclease signature motif containing protein [Sporichthya sp.]|uniref:HNH endonuclease signature motif containing protein n=1 Tax=Sporichthya sp. TaxID=65475 RepID=UPI0017BF4EDC|nr:HNH endonuclease signature motif containing protein [Sporichthya sp.]MBA3742365.1 DUF222 domain-containing protein [Sporichthya sp.]
MEGLRELTGREVVEVLRELYADQARMHAALLEAVWETVLCGEADSTRRMTDPDEWSADEVRAALGLTRPAATRLVSEAHDTCHRLPDLHEAMAAGRLDPARARVIADWVTELSVAHAQQVVAAVLPKCELGGQTCLTTGQLTEEIKTLAVALDPEWARRRYEGSLQDRKVVGSRTADGTAKLSGLNLAPERVAAAVARLDGLAKAAKRAGDKRPIDQLRADLFCGMTDGTYRGLNDDQILAALLASRPDAGNDAGNDAAERGKPAPAPAPASEPEPEPAPESSWAGVHLKVRLTTLLGLDRYPAEMAGWGTCHAELARQLVDQLGAAQWHYTFTCPDGFLVRTGLTTARPTGVRKRQASCQAVIEIVVPAGLLPKLLEANLDPSWGPVLNDLYEHLTEPKTQRLLDPGRRVPGAALRREVVAALRTCVGSGCRAPARTGDIDHRHDHAKGGQTVGANLNPVCRHDHRVKSEAGWQLRRIGDTFEWTTRLGHVYLTPVQPVLPDLPAQHPSEPEDDLPVNPDRDRLGEPWQRSTAWDETRHRRAEPEPQQPRPRPHPDDDPPPF